MRGRLIATVALLAAVVAQAPTVRVQAAASDEAEAPTIGGGPGAGGDRTATGSLLPDGANVVAEQSGGGDGPTGGGGTGAGGGGRDGDPIYCEQHWLGPHEAWATNRPMPNPVLTIDDLTAAYERESQPVEVWETCRDGSGAILSAGRRLWVPAEGGGLVDPAQLAELAREEVSWPSPVVEMSPSLADGTYAQLWTFFAVSNWAPVTSAPAVAGDVWATVTGTPVSQSWVIQDGYRGTSETVACDGPGALFDGSRAYEAQIPPACGWLPRHSSAGQAQTSPHSGEPCFPATVTVTWDVSWTSNVVPGGPLGQGTSSASLCLVVAELQATVVAPGAS